jgi:uncharacterized membrane protein YfcA
MESAICLAIGVAAGIVGGIFGIGGGVIILPALALLLRYSQKEAQGTSLVALLAPVGLLALINYYKAGQVHLIAGAWIAAGFFGGAWLGSKWALQVNDQVLRKAFAVFLVIVAFQLFFSKPQPKGASTGVSVTSSESKS